MYYEINVARNGLHFFATHERSLLTRDAATLVYNELAKRFPESEGFAITVRQIQVMSGYVQLN